MITIDTLREWSWRICEMRQLGREAAAKLLGVDGAPSVGNNYLLVKPTPDGATAMRVYNALVNKTNFEHVQLDLAPPGIAMAELTAVFGDGSLMPRVDYKSSYVIVFDVEPAGKPSRCSVIASFETAPKPDVRTTNVVLRRSPA